MVISGVQLGSIFLICDLNFYSNVVCLTTDAHLRMEEQRNIKYMHTYVCIYITTHVLIPWHLLLRIVSIGSLVSSSNCQVYAVCQPCCWLLRTDSATEALGSTGLARWGNASDAHGGSDSHVFHDCI